jgi:exonuclease SbcD
VRTPVRQVVVVAGNHDSWSRLEAPRELLRALRIHVVGGVLADDASRGRCLCPVPDADGRVAAVVLAVPYVHEVHLGVRTVLADEAAIRREFREKFAGFYTDLTSRALAEWGAVPVVGMGHLACTGGQNDDAPWQIHLAASAGGVPPEAFDPRLSYVALGHFHRMYPVDGRNAWYAGTPVPLTVREARTPRHVLVVDVPAAAGEAAAVIPLPVPLYRGIVELRGEPETVLREAQALEWTTPAPPLVDVTLEVARYEVGLEAELRRQWPEGDRAPRIVRVRQTAVGAAPTQAEAAPRPSLRELTPEDVFRHLCAARREPLDEELLAAFRSIVTAPVDGPEATA